MSIGVNWTIDGHTVPLGWSSVALSAPRGVGSLGQAVIPREAMPRHPVEIFSVVTGVRTDGVPFYVGEVVGPPHEHQGLVYLQVEGLAGRLARSGGRRLYQSRDIERWVLQDAEPHNYTITAGTIGSSSSGIVDFTQTHASGQAGVVFWAKGEDISRVAFTVSGGTWELLSAVGPDGTRTSETSGSGSDTVDETITAGKDLVALQISSSIDTRVRITELRVNGQTTADTFSSTELGGDIADVFGWRSISAGGSANVLPLDWDGDWQAGLTDAALLFDGTWLILPSSDAEADFYIGPWGRRTWTVRGADYSDLVPQVRYNRVVVGYQSVGGVELESSASAEDDIYANRALDVSWPPGAPYPLGNPQPDSTAADAAAEALVAYWSQPRVSGQVPIGRIWGPDGEGHPWDIDPGDLIEIPELDLYQDELGPQRVTEVSRNADGTAVVSVSEATSLESLLADIGGVSTSGLTFAIDAFEIAPRGRRKKRRKGGSHGGHGHPEGWWRDWEPSWKPDKK